MPTGIYVRTAAHGEAISNGLRGKKRKPFTEEHKRKISESNARLSGPAHPNWVDDPDYNVVHRWLRGFEKTGACEICGSEGKTEWAFKGDPGGYTRDREAYRELCTSCHKREDAKKRNGA